MFKQVARWIGLDTEEEEENQEPEPSAFEPGPVVAPPIPQPKPKPKKKAKKKKIKKRKSKKAKKRKKKAKSKSPSTKDQIVAYVKKRKTPVTPKQVAKKVGIAKSTARKYLYSLQKSGRVKKSEWRTK